MVYLVFLYGLGLQHQLCDCGSQLDEALHHLDTEGGYLLYLRQEGRGIGLYAKLDAYALQEQGFDTYEANRRLDYPDDSRDYGCAAKMLRALGILHFRLLTNNPDKVAQLRSHGFKICEIVHTGVFQNPYNQRYLAAKVKHARHELVLPATTSKTVTSNLPSATPATICQDVSIERTTSDVTFEVPLV
jgi:GTP cyclohydrolase II